MKYFLSFKEATQEPQERRLAPDLEAAHENPVPGIYINCAIVTSESMIKIISEATRQTQRNLVVREALLDVLAVVQDQEAAQEAVHVQGKF